MSSSDEEIETTALQVAQKENFELRKQLKELSVESNTETTQATEDAKRRDEIAKSGRMYSLMVAPWIDASLFDNLKGRPIIDTNHESRYSTKAAMLDGAVAELYDTVPRTLHDAMEHQSQFVTIFRNSAQGQRSNAILSVRQKAGVLFGFNQDFFDTTFNRGTIPEMQALLKIPNKEGYAIFAPVLFEDNKYNPKHKKLFLNPLLPRIAKTMLCGRSSSTSRPQTLAELWKVTAVTPGLISFSAILARFLLSPDDEMRKIGRTTGIKWYEEFMSYKQILTGDSKRVQEVLKFFNDNMFVNTVKVTTAPATLKENADELKKAMLAFREDYSDSDSEKDDDDHGSSDELPPPNLDSDLLNNERDYAEDRPRDTSLHPREQEDIDANNQAASQHGVNNSVRADINANALQALDVAKDSEVSLQPTKKQRNQSSNKRGGRRANTRRGEDAELANEN